MLRRWDGLGNPAQAVFYCGRVALVTQAFAEILTDCYGTPPAELARIHQLWPGGIGWDLFLDPMSPLRARGGFDVRQGGDAYTGTIPRGVRTVHGNGPFSGDHPTKTAALFARLVEHYPDREYLNLTLGAPGCQYWRRHIWPVGSAVAFLGRLPFVSLRPGQSQPVGEECNGNRNEAAVVYYGPRPAEFLEIWGAHVPAVPCRHVRAPKVIDMSSKKTVRTMTIGETVVAGEIQDDMAKAALAALAKANPPLSQVRALLERAGAWEFVQNWSIADLLPGATPPKPRPAKPKPAAAKAAAAKPPPPPPKTTKKATKKRAKAKPKAKASSKDTKKNGAPYVSEATLATVGKYLDARKPGETFKMQAILEDTGLVRKTVLRAFKKLPGRVKTQGAGSGTMYTAHTLN